MTPPIIVFSSKYKLNLLAAVIVVTILGGFVWWKTYSPNNVPPPLVTTANMQMTLHWAHQSKPFTLKVVNNGSTAWNENLTRQIEKWDMARVASLVNIPGAEITCELNRGTINVCSFNDAENSVIALTQTVYDQSTLHIESSRIAFNDTHLNKGSNYEKDVLKNNLVCRNLGLAIGAKIRYNEPAHIGSCMNPLASGEMLEQAQNPDLIDLNSLIKLYHHDDIQDFVPIRYTLPDSANFADSTKWGNLVETIDSGNIEIYEQFLGDGYKMVTVAQRK